eukprot:8796035-Lingulodinium_polyedra.AAC.1
MPRARARVASTRHRSWPVLVAARQALRLQLQRAGRDQFVNCTPKCRRGAARRSAWCAVAR